MVAFALGVGLTQLLAYRLTRSRWFALLVAGLVLANPAILSVMLTPLPTALVFMSFALLLVLVVEPTPLRAVLAGGVYVGLLLAKGYAVLYFLPVAGYLAVASRGVKLPLLFIASVVSWSLAAQFLLPAGSVRLISSGSGYSLAFLHEWWYPRHVLGFNDLTPPDPWPILLQHPEQFALHYARLASRTKRILDAMSGPAIGGLLFPLLWLAMAVFSADRLRPGFLFPEPKSEAPRLVRDGDVLVFFSSLVVVTLVFFWAISSPRIVYWSHLYPIMLLLSLAFVWRLMPLGPVLPRTGRRCLAAAAVLYFLVYPLALTARELQKDNFVYFGRGLAVRGLDYGEMSKTLSRAVPNRSHVVVSDMANEIAWWNRHPTIHFPLDQAQLRFLVERFDVAALYEHPSADRGWDYMRDEFRLVDTRNGRLWVRKTSD